MYRQAADTQGLLKDSKASISPAAAGSYSRGSRLLSAADGVEDVLRLLQVLFAISQDVTEDQLLNVPAEEFYSKKVTNKVIQQIQVLCMPS